MNNKYYVGQKASSFLKYEKTPPVSKIRLFWDDENAFEAGDDTGYTIELFCPSATQKMADNILNAAKGFVYQGFSAPGSSLVPEAELGDGVTVDGFYGMIANRDIEFGPGNLSDISAPGEKEINHEYPYLSSESRELKRKVTLGTSYYGTKITRKNGLEITKTDNSGAEKSRVILNSDILAFYNDDGQAALYFDAASGRYIFRGDINMQGGSIYWGDSFPYKSQFSTSPDGPWHDKQQEGDKYRRDTYDGGKTWEEPYQSVGTDGRDGIDGSDASVTFNNVLRALQRAEATQTTFITADELGAPTIYGAKIYGAEIYAGGVDDMGGQIIGLLDTGMVVWNGDGERVLTISGNADTASLVTGYNILRFNCPYMSVEATSSVSFHGRLVSFDDVNEVSGLYLRFS